MDRIQFRCDCPDACARLDLVQASITLSYDLLTTELQCLGPTRRLPRPPRPRRLRQPTAPLSWSAPPYGSKFHDKIRELLLARLKFNKPEYDRIVERLTNYYAKKAGIEMEEEQEPPNAKHNIHIHTASGVAIGDQARVEQHFDEAQSDDASADDG